VIADTAVINTEDGKAKGDVLVYQEIQDMPLNGRDFTELALTVPVKNVYADLSVWTNRVELLAPIVAPMLGLETARRVRLIGANDAADEGVELAAELTNAGNRVSSDVR